MRMAIVVHDHLGGVGEVLQLDKMATFLEIDFLEYLQAQVSFSAMRLVQAFFRKKLLSSVVMSVAKKC